MNRKIITDIAFAAVSQALFFLIPVLLIPHLTSALSSEVFGLTIVVQSYALLAALVVDWSHSWSTTRDIARTSSIARQSVIISRAWACQLFTAFMLTLMFGVIFIFFEGDLLEKISFESILLLIFSLSFNLSWAVNGIQQIKFYAVATIIQRISLLIATITLVVNEVHGGRYIFFLALTQIFCGLLCVWYMCKIGYSIIPKFHFKYISRVYRVGGDLFSARVAISLYSSLVPIILAKVAGAHDVAIYGIADRVRLAAFSAISPITQVLFPRLSFMMHHQKEGVAKTLALSAAIIFCLSACLSIVLYFGADLIVAYLTPDTMGGAADVLRIMAPLPFVLSVSNLFGIQIMIPNGFTKPFRNILVVCALLGLPLILIGSIWRGAIGAGISVVLVEVVISCVMAFSLRGYFRSLIAQKDAAR
jgi:O-antigen/teichoic acid export membrane protein